MNRTVPLIVFVLSLLSGCDSLGEGVVPGRADITLAELFAAPTPEELAAIEATSFGTDLPPLDVRIEGMFPLTGGGTLRVVSHLVDGNRHVGAIATPDGTGPLAITISASGYGPPFELDLGNVQADTGGRAMTLYPSFRGTTVRFGENHWTSDGPRYDQCSGATRDLISFLNVALAMEPRADAERIVAAGGSRGGNVSMMAAIRDARIDAVASLAGPTDYFVADYVTHPNLSVLYEEGFLRGLRDRTESVAQARANMLACSPAYWLDRLPPTQIHHGLADQQVPVEQARSFEHRRDQANLGDDRIQFFYYPEAGHSLESVRTEVNQRISVFLSGILFPEQMQGP